VPWVLGHLLASSLMAGLFVANEDNDPIVTFRIDRQTGMLSLEGETIRTGSPVCIIFGVAA
jgi:6-phosphogluconolactonase